MALLVRRAQALTPIYRTSRLLRNSRGTQKVSELCRCFANGSVPPLNEALPGVERTLPNCSPYVTRGHEYETRISTLENGIKVASEDSFGQFSTVGGFAERLQMEVGSLMDNKSHVQIHAGVDRQHASFIGASVLAKLPLFDEMCVSQEDWDLDGVDALEKWYSQ